MLPKNKSNTLESGEMLSVVEEQGAGYRIVMSLEDAIRKRIVSAIADDTKGRRGRPRSVQQIAEEAGVDPDHLRKYQRGDSGMGLDKLAQVAAALGVEVSWLVAGTRHLPSDMPHVPVVDSGRYPLDAPNDRRLELVELESIGSGVNMSEDPKAHWIRLAESFGELEAGDWILLTPSLASQPGDLVAAVIGRRFVVGKLQLFRGEKCLVMHSGHIYDGTQFQVLAVVHHHLKRTLKR